ncbi:MAG: hypothetical protein ACREN8_05230 [Candidatus Dormibacteraceae bacterium]
MEGRKNSPFWLHVTEDLTSTYPEDIELWVQVYGELVDFKHQLLSDVLERIKAREGSPVAEEIHEDQLAMECELKRLELHLTFWRERSLSSVVGRP